MESPITQFLPSDELPSPVLPGKAVAQLAAAQLALQSGISWIFDLGIRPDMPFYLKKNLALINRVSFLSLLLALPGSLLLLLVGFEHTFSLLVCGTSALLFILTLNKARQVDWSLAIFAFFPATIIMGYTLIELSSGELRDLLLYVLVRQGLCLSLVLPVIIYGFEKSRRSIVLGLGILIFLAFDVGTWRWGSQLFRGNLGISQGIFSILSLSQLIMLSICVIYVQAYTMHHEQDVRVSNEKLRHMAIRDGMTGLFNHTFIEGLIGDAINRAKRSKSPISLLMIDVDSFKKINDSLGHNAGDTVLVHLAKLLQCNKRSTDYLGRWGGDELILLLTDTHLQGATLLAEKLRMLVDQHVFPGKTHLTLSLGASQYCEGDSLAEFIRRADENLYQAKHMGRNRVEVQ